ncbi:DEAD/DEAH box helicase [Dietzia sp. DQ11-71]|nr:DEAD/DEAH box helicase [Dietzia sp. DQ11-71]
MSARLSQLLADKKSREKAIAAPEDTNLVVLETELREAGFKRQLKNFQLENLARIVRLPHGADFSVPGAGKTSVALANFALQRSRGGVKRLLVVAPIAAFEAWKTDAEDCFVTQLRIVVHQGKNSVLPTNTDVVLTNYNRLASDYDAIADYVASVPTQVVLDEAHRVKKGSEGVHGSAVIDLAYVAARRDVLTGTPTPQGASDIVALVRFLYPGQDKSILPAAAYEESAARDDSVVKETSAAIDRYFVRTRKSDLNIPAPVWITEMRDTGPVQAAIYAALLGRYRGDFSLSTDSRRMFGRLGRVVMYLLEAASNPLLLLSGSDDDDEIGFAHPPMALNGNEPLTQLLNEYAYYERPWKYEFVKEQVAEAAARGDKVLVWSNFVRNIRLLRSELADYNPAVIHGGVPPEDSARPGSVTRESELERFRHSSDCSVLLANPAAAGEGISLHHWCHHAIFLDRTFNAGHFLQSQDRIHRLGLDPDVETRFTVLVSRGTIDESVDSRLRDKVTALAGLMNDPGLVTIALPQNDEDPTAPAVETSDARTVREHIRGR